MAQTGANVIGTEIEAVAKKVPALFDRETAHFWSKIEKRPTEVISDRDMRIPLEMQPGGRFGQYDPDGGDLGRGDASKYDKAVINSVHMKYAVEWTTKAQWATDSSRKAVLDTFKKNMANAMPEFRRGFESLMMTSGNGVLGTITAKTDAGANEIYTLDTDFGVKLLRYGQYINVYDSTLATRRTTGEGTQILGYDLVNKQITVADVAGSVAGDKIVISGPTTANPVSMYGIPYHHNNASTGTWLGFDRSTTPEVRANRVDAGNSSFALPFARLAVNKMLDRVGMDEGVKMDAWMHPCQVQAYEEQGQLISHIQKQAKEEGLNLYFSETGMQMAGVPVKQSFMWHRKRIDFIRYDYWGRAELHPAGMYTQDGRKIWEVRGSSGGVATSNLFYLVASFNTFMNNPAGGLYIDNLAIPSGY